MSEIKKLRITDPQKFIDHLAEIRVVAYHLQQDHDGKPKIYGEIIIGLLKKAADCVDIIE